jgi:FkbM family methyltransferase
MIKDLFFNSSPEIILDAGANIGLFSIYALSLWPTVEIFGIEASLETYSTLKRTQEKNPEYDWHIYQYALWDKDGEVFFDDEGLSLGWHVAKNMTSLRVPATRLDSFINNNIPKDKRISLLKIDIEGAEQSVLQACPEILTRVDSMLIEIHPHQCDKDAVIDILREKFSYLYDLSTADSHFPIILANRQSLPANKFPTLS